MPASPTPDKDAKEAGADNSDDGGHDGHYDTDRETMAVAFVARWGRRDAAIPSVDGNKVLRDGSVGKEGLGD
jgi:hypothetical protein